MLIEEYEKLISGCLDGIEYSTDFFNLDSNTDNKAVLTIKRGFKKKELTEEIKGSLYYEILDNVASIILVKGKSPHFLVVLKGGIVVSSVESYGNNVIYRDLFAYAAKVFHHIYGVEILTFDYDEVIVTYDKNEAITSYHVQILNKGELLITTQLEIHPIGGVINVPGITMTGRNLINGSEVFRTKDKIRETFSIE